MTTASEPILVCAATVWEARPLARLGGRARVLTTGVGPAAAARALDGLTGGVSRVLSAGLCGALQPGMAPGDLVLDLRGEDAELPPAAREAASALGLSAHFGRVLSSDRVLTPAEKSEAGRRERACAVDMESAALRRFAQARGVPFLTVRAVLDGVDDLLPSGLPEGDDALSLLRYAAARPLEWPRMARTGWRQARAMRGLALFLERLLPRL